MKIGYYTNTQSLFLPAVYMMARFAQCQYVVIMEEAQFHRKGHQARTLAYDQNGKESYLSMPVSKADRKPLNEVDLVDPIVHLPRLLRKVYGYYHKFPKFKEGFESFEGIIDMLVKQKSCSNEMGLNELNVHLMTWGFAISGIEAKLVMSRSIVDPRPENPSDWMAELGHGLGAYTYYTSHSGMQEYLSTQSFHKYGIQLRVQSYNMSKYRVIGDSPPNAWVTFLDPLFYLGIEEYRQLIRDGVGN